MLDSIPPDIFEQYERKKPEGDASLERPEISAERKAEPREVRPSTEEPGGGRQATFAQIEKIPEKPRETLPPEEKQRQGADAMVEKLVELARTGGEEAALAQAKNLDPYIQDRLHARLVEEEKGKHPEQ